MKKSTHKTRNFNTVALLFGFLAVTGLMVSMFLKSYPSVAVGAVLLVLLFTALIHADRTAAVALSIVGTICFTVYILEWVQKPISTFELALIKIIVVTIFTTCFNFVVEHVVGPALKRNPFGLLALILVLAAMAAAGVFPLAKWLGHEFELAKDSLYGTHAFLEDVLLLLGASLFYEVVRANLSPSPAKH